VSESPIQYRAFISYSHKDERIASRLHRKLEAYRLPRKLRKSGQTDSSRIRPVFRDRDELASASSLTESIENALAASQALIVVCSPDAVASRWVNEEIRYFRTLHPERSVLAFVVAGNPGGDPRDTNSNAAIPLKLLLNDPAREDGDLLEPVAAHASRDGDGFSSAFLKLVAGLADVPYDHLRQRDLHRKQRIWASISLASLLLTSILAVLTWRATIARNEARMARAQAELELISERQTRDFLLSVFKLADPGEARGNEVTVREVLDRAVARIDSSEFARPVIKARFLASMGQAYSSLGMTQRSKELLEQSLGVLPGDALSEESWTQRIDSRIELADLLFYRGEYEAATQHLGQVTSDPAVSHVLPIQMARVNNIRGDILSYTEQDEAAMSAYQASLAVLEAATTTREENASIRSRSLGGIAILHHFAGDYAESQRYYYAAVNILLPVFGEKHPDTLWAMLSWGSAAYSNGDTKTARQAWVRTLALARELLDETHPEVSTIKNNLGRLLFETGEYLEAEVLLRDALEIDRMHRSESFDDLAYILHNLSLVRMAQGDNHESMNLLLEALNIADSTHHRTLGPILTALADIHCQTDQAVAGMALATRALEANSAEYGEDDWRSQRTELTLTSCQFQSGEPRDPLQLDPAVKTIVTRWGVENYFSKRAVEQQNSLRP
jgi:tetratricopeptide (TPR) repeat protein